MELSSLSLASSINKKGIYLISAPRENKVHPKSCGPEVMVKVIGLTFASSLLQLSLDTVLKLQIPEENDEAQRMRCYSLEDLRELQNKLMLMSGKGDQGQNEVDHFVEVCFFFLWWCFSQLSQ